MFVRVNAKIATEGKRKKKKEKGVSLNLFKMKASIWLKLLIIIDML